MTTLEVGQLVTVQVRRAGFAFTATVVAVASPSTVLIETTDKLERFEVESTHCRPRNVQGA